MAYFTPATVSEATALLAAHRPRVLAGGTDVYPLAGERALDGDILDLTRVADLRTIASDKGGLIIGAAVRWSEIARASLPPAFRALQQAAGQVGGIQIQNAGTVAGNICNASPAADGVPPLLVLDAQVEIAGPGGFRTMPLADFLLGPRKTALRPGEIVVALRLPAPPENTTSAFEKLGSRAYLVISIAMVAALVRIDAGRIAEARIAVGACSPVALRLPGLEADLIGQNPSHVAVTPAHLAQLAPLSDARGTAAYRLEAAADLITRAVARAGGGDG